MGPADPQSCRAEEKTVGMGGRDDGALFRDPHPAGRWYSQAAQGATLWNEDGYLTGTKLCCFLHLKIPVWVHLIYFTWKFTFEFIELTFLENSSFLGLKTGSFLLWFQLFVKLSIVSFKSEKAVSILVSLCVWAWDPWIETLAFGTLLGSLLLLIMAFFSCPRESIWNWNGNLYSSVQYLRCLVAIRKMYLEPNGLGVFHCWSPFKNEHLPITPEFGTGDARIDKIPVNGELNPNIWPKLR